MRRLRLLMMGTAALALLGGQSGAVVAQPEEADGDQASASWVEGTSRLINNIDFGEQIALDDGSPWWNLRGRVVEGVVEANDQRISGSTTATLNWDSHPVPFAGDTISAGPLWGTQRIENDGGAWECSWSGGDMTMNRSEYVSWCVGLDGYEGWAMQLLMTATDTAGTNDFVGLLWPGELPPLPAPPPAAE